jgi:hypothetical protein
VVFLGLFFFVTTIVTTIITTVIAKLNQILENRLFKQFKGYTWSEKSRIPIPGFGTRAITSKTPEINNKYAKSVSKCKNPPPPALKPKDSRMRASVYGQTIKSAPPLRRKSMQRNCEIKAFPLNLLSHFLSNQIYYDNGISNWQIA